MDTTRPDPARSLFDLGGRIAAVTGGAGHLGSAMAAALADAGATVYIAGRTRRSLDRVAEGIRSRGGKVQVMACDVNDDRSVQRWYQEIEVSAGRLDVLVNNAFTGPAGTVATTSMSDLSDGLTSGVEAAYRCILGARSLLDAAVERVGHASVVNIASMYGLVSPDPRIYGSSGFDSPPSYAAAKGALIQLTRYLACHLAPARIRVNAVAPGPFPAREVTEADQDFVERLAEKVPLGRIGKAWEVGGGVVFLASDAATYVTGTVLPIDGGWTAW